MSFSPYYKITAHVWLLAFQKFFTFHQFSERLFILQNFHRYSALNLQAFGSLARKEKTKVDGSCAIPNARTGQIKRTPDRLHWSMSYVQRWRYAATVSSTSSLLLRTMQSRTDEQWCFLEEPRDLDSHCPDSIAKESEIRTLFDKILQSIPSLSMKLRLRQKR